MMKTIRLTRFKMLYKEEKADWFVFWGDTWWSIKQSISCNLDMHYGSYKGEEKEELIVPVARRLHHHHHLIRKEASQRWLESQCYWLADSRL